MPPNSKISLKPELIAATRALLEKNLVLTAWESLGMEAESLKNWEAGPARHLAARLLAPLGNGRLATVLDLLNAREFPDNFRYSFRQFFHYLSKYGSYAAREKLSPWLARRDKLKSSQVAELLTLQSWIHADLQDFKPAFRLSQEARELDPKDAWVWSQHSEILVMDDQYDEALESAQHSRKLRPGYRPAVLQEASCLILLGRDDEAESLLLGAHENFENPGFVGQLQAIYSDRDDIERVVWCLDEYERLTPLRGKHITEWLQKRRADMLLLQGKGAEALAQISDIKEGFYHKAAENLALRGAFEKKRAKLDVPFIRQHNMTCAPATLASLSKFWGKNHDHLEIADAICYEGTPWFKERQWMEKNGFVAREFHLTEEILRTLIDRGVPFTLSTSWATGAHLQACIGYDERVGVAILRDPTSRHYGEIMVKDLIEDHPIEGPHATVMIPLEKAAILNGIIFPDEEIYIAYHHFCVVHDANDEAGMALHLQKMQRLDANAPLCLRSRLSLAYYHEDVIAQFVIASEIRTRFPDSDKHAYRLSGILSDHSSRHEHLDFLKKFTLKKETEAVFYAEYGEALLEETRDWDLAHFYLRRAARFLRRDSRSFSSLSRYHSMCGEREMAAKYMRVASQLSAGHEPYALSYFHKANITNQGAEGLAYLRERVEKLGAKNTGPWITLAESLHEIGQSEEARKVLEEALEKHPDDGELGLVVAQNYTGWGQVDAAREIMPRLKGKVSTIAWHDRQAQIVRFLGDRLAAMDELAAITAHQDSHINAHTRFAYLLQEEEGFDAARDYFAKVLERHPDNLTLLIDFAGFLSDDFPRDALPLFDRILEKQPNNLWALRQKALSHKSLGESAEALTYSREAYEKNPFDPADAGVYADCLLNDGGDEKALTLLREALCRDIDYSWAMRHFYSQHQAAGTIAEGLDFLQNEIRKQVSDGSCYGCFRSLAYPNLAPEKLLAFLRECAAERPDLWQIRATIQWQLDDMGQPENAHAEAEKLVHDFPLTPRSYVELFNTEKNLGNREAELAALEKALELSPSWDWLALRIAQSNESLGRFGEARLAYEKAILWNPLNPANAGHLADMLWKNGKKEDAYDVLARSLEMNSEYIWGWTTVFRWSQNLERDPLPLLEKQRDRRSFQAQWWLTETDIFCEIDDFETALEKIDQAISLDPRDVDYHDRKAWILTTLKRYDEALAACAPEIFAGKIPRALQGRAADVQWESTQRRSAVNSMKKIVADFPDYSWAYGQLIDWLNQLGEHEDQFTYAKKWTRIDPSNAIAWGQLAHIQIIREEKTEALVALKKAYALDPEYSYASYKIATISLELNDFKTTEDLLPAIAHDQSPHSYLLVEIQLRLAQDDKEATLATLEKLFTLDVGNYPDLCMIEELFKKNGWRDLFTKHVKTFVEEGKAGNPAVINAWINPQTSVEICANKLQALPYPSEKIKSWSFIIKWAAGRPATWVTKRFVKKHPIFKEDTFLWGRLGYLMSTYNQHKLVVSWLGDYQQREKMEAWIMVNNVESIISLDKLKNAKKVCQYSLENCPPSYGTNHLIMLSALIHALEGELEKAREILDNPHDEIDDYDARYSTLTKILIAAKNPNLTRVDSKKHWEEFVKRHPQWKQNEVSVRLVRMVRWRTKNKWPGSILLPKFRPVSPRDHLINYGSYALICVLAFAIIGSIAILLNT